MTRKRVSARKATARLRRELARAWPQLVATDLGYKLVALLALSPLVGLAVRLGVGLSGNQVLADQEIARFLLTPVGLMVLVMIGGLSIAVIALEIASLMAIVAVAARGDRVGVVEALGWTLARSRAVLGLTVRLVGRLCLLASPFLAALAAVYLVLLGRFDINYYLAERPPGIIGAVALAVLLLSGFAWVVLPRLVSWTLALPLVAFEGVPAARAFAESDARVRNDRRAVARLAVGWVAWIVAISIVVPGLVLAVGRVVVPSGQGRIGTVVAVMLAVAIVWALVNLAVSWVAVCSFALLIAYLHDELGGGTPLLEGLGSDAGSTRLGWAVSGRRAAALAALVAIGAGVWGYQLLTDAGAERTVLVIAHRGAAGAAPENTRASVDEALRQGSDMVEIDVQETADGEVVVIHDSDFMKVAGVDLKVWDATWDEASRIDIGSWFAPEFADERLPRLADVLERSRGAADVTIELKYYGHDEALETRVIEIVESLGVADDVVVMSLKYEAVEKMRALRPDWTVGLLTATAVGDLTRLDADFLAVNSGMVTRSFVRRAHAVDKAVYAWTVNDPVQMVRMINRGVDGLITDEPGLANEVIRRRGELTPFERSLLEVAFFLGAAAPDPPASVDAPE